MNILGNKVVEVLVAQVSERPATVKLQETLGRIYLLHKEVCLLDEEAKSQFATMSIKIHANRVLGTKHVTQNFVGVFKGAQIKSGPKAPTDLNAALLKQHLR